MIAIHRQILRHNITTHTQLITTYTDPAVASPPHAKRKSRSGRHLELLDQGLLLYGAYGNYVFRLIGWQLGFDLSWLSLRLVNEYNILVSEYLLEVTGGFPTQEVTS